ncbi:hypothetical protein IE53DRAFT_119535 [Violaceomyces palustris]|uniref:Uncharacterized protein n=1 Tax=Violaceomyces palustris TaxID=1673888 RepID=A0ACD0NW18_9BASI|nr:hypothetical protein IE53DRAFT_119535 [Violaceomyces palustris]
MSNSKLRHNSRPSNPLLQPSSPRLGLADSTRHLPTPSLTRKIKSCDACRKMKIKCVFESDQDEKCKRCEQRGLQCVLNKSLQTILSNDLAWKNQLQDDMANQQVEIDRLKEMVAGIQERLDRITRSSPSPSLSSSSFPHSLTEQSSPSEIGEGLSHAKKRRRLASPLSHHQPSHHDPTLVTSPGLAEEEGQGTQGRIPNDAGDVNDTPYVSATSPLPIATSLSNNGGDGTTPAPFLMGPPLGDPSPPREQFQQPGGGEGDGGGIGHGSLQDSVLPLRAPLQKQTDIISRGLLPLKEAESLFTIYLESMDRHLFHIIRQTAIEDPQRRPPSDLGSCMDARLVSVWMEEVRRSSTLLLLSILAVAALHTARKGDPTGASPHSHPFPLVYREFVKLAATQAFSRQQTLDDIRALVIGAFWLPDISWILVGTAVRISTERGLHLSYKSSPPGEGVGDRLSRSATSYEEARIYYMIYVVDHHASIPHGRPPMTRQHTVIRSSHEWLARCSASHGIRVDDQRLVAQVKLWEILHDVIDEMGSDVHVPLDERSLALEQRFSIELKRWLDESQLRMTWSMSSRSEKSLAIYLNELELSHAFAFLFLESSAFRAPQGETPDFLIEARLPTSLSTTTSTPTKGSDYQAGGLLLRKKLMADRALEMARQVLCALKDSPPSGKVAEEKFRLSSEELRHAPVYTYSMIISAIVFLVKMHENSVNCRIHDQSRAYAGHDGDHVGSSCRPTKRLEEDLLTIRSTLSFLERLVGLNSDQHIVVKILEGADVLISQLGTQLSSSTMGHKLVGSQVRAVVPEGARGIDRVAMAVGDGETLMTSPLFGPQSPVNSFGPSSSRHHVQGHAIFGPGSGSGPRRNVERVDTTPGHDRSRSVEPHTARIDRNGGAFRMVSARGAFEQARQGCGTGQSVAADAILPGHLPTPHQEGGVERLSSCREDPVDLANARQGTRHGSDYADSALRPNESQNTGGNGSGSGSNNHFDINSNININDGGDRGVGISGSERAPSSSFNLINSQPTTGGAGLGSFTIDQFDLLSDMRPLSGLDFWPDIFGPSPPSSGQR